MSISVSHTRRYCRQTRRAYPALALLCTLAALPLHGQGHGPQELTPVLAYDFAAKLPGIAVDVSGNRNHGAISGTKALILAPLGNAMRFDGATSIGARTSDALVMTSELTLDVWLRLDALGQTGCVIDKQGERYRLQITSSGQCHFGLKAGGRRADLVAGQLEVGRWHRVTCVFKRPQMRLFIDGQQVGTKEWDHAPDAGSRFFVGAKSGGYDFFRGAIDQLRIYSVARDPLDGDEHLTLKGSLNSKEATLTMTRQDDSTIIDTGPMQVTLDCSQGWVRELTVDGKHLIAGNAVPLLFATLMESSEYDGTRDHVPRTFITGQYSCNGLNVSRDDDRITAAGAGALTFSGGDAIRFALTLTVATGDRRLHTAVRFEPAGTFKDRFVHTIGMRQPLSLNTRKRIIQAGDQGLRWDTRLRYQFHMHVDIASEPDHNWWRHFYVDQETDHSYCVWRAEDMNTAPLTPFRGRRAPGWMTAYDEQGGVLFAYRQFPERAPKALCVNADGQGEAVVYVHSPTHPACDVRNPVEAASIFGAAHETDWVFFTGEEAIAQPDRQLASIWQVEALASDSPVKPDPVDDELDLFNAPAATAGNVPYVMGGIPLPRGAISNTRQCRLAIDDRDVPLQAETLAFWPDGSIKWLLLIFPLDGAGGMASAAGTGAGDSVDFDVSLRTGKAVRCRLTFGPGIVAGAVHNGIQTERTPDGVTLRTGPLEVALAPGQRWLASVRLNGQEMLRDDGQAQAHVDFLRPQGEYPVSTTHPEGTPDPGPVVIDKVELEEDGPLRAVVRLEGRAQAQEPPRVILRVEAYAGRSYVRVVKSVEFMHKDPRKAFVRRLGLHLPLTLSPSGHRLAAGAQDGPIQLQPAPKTGLRQTSHLNYSIWQQQADARHIRSSNSAHRSRGWLDVAAGDHGLAVVLRDMWQDAPKELVAQAHEPSLEVGLWPESAPLMDVRRYSNYPHRAQGESVTWDRWWVEDSYYVNDPFIGVSKTHELLLFFHDARVSPTQIDSVAADFQSRPLVYPGWSWFEACRVTLPHVAPDAADFARSQACMQNLADWWLFHQRFWGWYGFWDYGDVRHLFHSGYGRIFPPETLAAILQQPDAVKDAKAMAQLPRRQDYFPQNDWAYDNGRWGWGNTEGLANLFMSMQYLRTGRRDLFFFMEANARHVRDVDARHAGMWFGRGTRHGVQHWSDGNHEERQTTFTEQRLHYLLTGEQRTREWNQELSDRYYLVGTCPNHASHSGRTYGLLLRWEITGDSGLGEVLRRYMHCLAQPDGLAVNSQIRFPEAAIVGEPRELHGGSMFFHTFGAMHAMLEYYELTHDARVKKAIIGTADYAVSEGSRAVSGMYRKVVAFAAREASDPDKYTDALRDALTRHSLRLLYQLVPAKTVHWTGPTAFLLGSVPGALFWINDAGYVLTALEAEPAPTQQLLDEMSRLEERPVTATVRFPRESWQSEYDRPEFSEYFREKPRPTRE